MARGSRREARIGSASDIDLGLALSVYGKPPRTKMPEIPDARSPDRPLHILEAWPTEQ